MTLLVTSLASGSSGNVLLIRAAGKALLVDCGLSMRVIEHYLMRAGIEPGDICAILLTHEHSDHALSAGKLARRHGVPVVCNGPTHTALSDHLVGVPVEELPVGQHGKIGPFDVTSFAVPHDAAAPVGYRISACDATLGLATDLGSWTDNLVTELRAADLLIIEANHDRERLHNAPYPQAIRQRIFSPQGHLDNIQAGELVARIGSDGRARDVWLAHLSQQANSPRIALESVRRVLRLAQVSTQRLAVLPRKTVPGATRQAAWSSDSMFQQRELFG